MADPLRFEASNSAIGLFTRRPTNGEEIDFVRDFAERSLEFFSQEGEDLAYFFEPLIETSYPDLVVVSYDRNVFFNWNDRRSKVGFPELKLLQHLHQCSSLEETNAALTLGEGAGRIRRRFEILHDSGLAVKSGARWMPVHLDLTFGIRRIVAIEAKLGVSQRVIHQALTNRWFASEVWILSKSRKPSSEFLDCSTSFGIGLFLGDEHRVRKVVKPVILGLPSSYASWLFNEWIGRTLWSSRKEVNS